MATKKNEETVVSPTTEKVPEKPKAVKYPKSEIVSAYKSFNAPRFLVETALNLSGKDSFTEEEAARIIKTFMNKEV